MSGRKGNGTHLRSDSPGIVASFVELSERETPCADANDYATRAIEAVLSAGTDGSPWSRLRNLNDGRKVGAIQEIWRTREALFEQVKLRARLDGYERGVAWVAAAATRNLAVDPPSPGVVDARLDALAAERGRTRAQAVVEHASGSGLKPATVDMLMWLAASYGMVGE